MKKVVTLSRGYKRSRKEIISNDDFRKMLSKARNTFRKELTRTYKRFTYEEVVAMGEEHARKVMEENVGGERGSYTTFLEAWLEKSKETEEQRKARYAGNYLRHVRGSYDDVIREMKMKNNLTRQNTNEIWQEFMGLAVEFYPQLKSSVELGLTAKEKFSEFQLFGYLPEDPDFRLNS